MQVSIPILNAKLVLALFAHHYSSYIYLYKKLTIDSQTIYNLEASQHQLFQIFDVTVRRFSGRPKQTSVYPQLRSMI